MTPDVILSIIVIIIVVLLAFFGSRSADSVYFKECEPALTIKKVKPKCDNCNNDLDIELSLAEKEQRAKVQCGENMIQCKKCKKWFFIK